MEDYRRCAAQKRSRTNVIKIISLGDGVSDPFKSLPKHPRPNICVILHQLKDTVTITLALGTNDGYQLVADTKLTCVNMEGTELWVDDDWEKIRQNIDRLIKMHKSSLRFEKEQLEKQLTEYNQLLATY